MCLKMVSVHIVHFVFAETKQKHVFITIKKTQLPIPTPPQISKWIGSVKHNHITL